MDFYFVDERGNDSINFETIENGSLKKYRIASKFFQIGVLKINRKQLVKLQKHFNSIRYFLNLTKEFEKIISSKKAFMKLWNIIEDIAVKKECFILSTQIEKESYVGPYLYKDRDVHRFKIFNIYRNLSYAMKVFKTPEANKAQIIIDRFSMSLENENNAIAYLNKQLKKYYSIIEVAFIDSRCSDYLQLIDVIITVVDEKKNCLNPKFCDYNIVFIVKKNFTN